MQVEEDDLCSWQGNGLLNDLGYGTAFSRATAAKYGGVSSAEGFAVEADFIVGVEGKLSEGESCGMLVVLFGGFCGVDTGEDGSQVLLFG